MGIGLRESFVRFRSVVAEATRRAGANPPPGVTAMGAGGLFSTAAGSALLFDCV
jgi:hypothetical protein